VVEARHLKQPAETMGTFNVRHDHAAGRSRITGDDLPVTDGRKKGRAERQARVREHLAEHPGDTVRQVKDALGLDASEETVRGDIKDVRRAAAEQGFAERRAPPKATPIGVQNSRDPRILHSRAPEVLGGAPRQGNQPERKPRRPGADR